MNVPAALDWRARAVLRRNAAIYFRTWYIGLLPQVCEPIIFLLAFGFGLGAHIPALSWSGREVRYLDYLAPGLIAYTSFTTPFFQGLYAAYVRMHYQKTWDGLLTSQVELQHVVWGEILWAGTLGMIFSALVCVALVLCGLLGLTHLRWEMLPMLPPMAFLAGCSFAALALVFTALVPSIDHMNIATYLVGFPVAFLSDTYFPVHAGHPVLAALVAINPVHQLSETYRGLLLAGNPAHHGWALAATAGALLAVCAPLVQRLMRCRVLGG